MTTQLKFTSITNIILDMDGTLLDNTVNYGLFDSQVKCETRPIARPYLKTFMEYVFEKFERVSIWTHGTKDWYDLCFEKVLQYVIPRGEQFHFVITRNDEPEYVQTYNMPRAKPLTEIYAKYPEYNEFNTIVIDDMPYTYVLNIDNAIPIKSFSFDSLDFEIQQNLERHDYELLRIIEILHKLIKEVRISSAYNKMKQNFSSRLLSEIDDEILDLYSA